MNKLSILMIATATAFTMTSAMAAPKGSWTGSVGLGYVNPSSDNGSLANGAYNVDVDPSTRPTLTGEYFVADNIGVEVLAAWPFQHDITLTDNTGATFDAQTKQLPPTVSLQYHFDDYSTKFKPFVGLGLNYTAFFSEEIDSRVGNDLDIENSFGVAGHIGVDFPLANNDAVRVDTRYIKIEPDVKLDGAALGNVDINPWVYGIAYVKNF